MTNLVNVEHVSYRTFRASSGKPATAGGVEIEGRQGNSHGWDGGSVILSVFSVDAVARIEVEAEDIERAAALLAAIRRECGDYRSVCAEHGLHHGYECPECNVPEAAPVQPPTPAPAPATPMRPEDMPF